MVLIHWAEKYADENNIPKRIFYADWDKYGKSAGPMRNKKMMKQGKPDQVVAFFGGIGTKSAIKYARKFGIPVTLYK